MKRGSFFVFVVLGLAAAGFSAVALGAPAQTAPPATKAKPKPARQTPVKRPPPTLPARVRVAGVRVGGLKVAAAEKAVRKAFAKPLTVVVGGRTLRLDPTKLAKAYVEGAVGHGRAARPGTSVPLVVTVHGSAVRAWADKIAQRLDRRPRDARLRLRNGEPSIVPHRLGKRLVKGKLVQKVVHALASNSRRPVRVAMKAIKPKLLASGFGRVIVIQRGSNRLSLFKGDRLWRSFRVATGQSAYPTPLGRFEIVVKWTNPWWYPPSSDWAQGLSPVPPGPSNPLGTRWMGLSASGVGIHGTPQPQSIGYSVSHGCIRMLVPEAEWLYDHVDVGTTVFIL